MFKPNQHKTNVPVLFGAAVIQYTNTHTHLIMLFLLRLLIRTRSFIADFFFHHWIFHFSFHVLRYLTQFRRGIVFNRIWSCTSICCYSQCKCVLMYRFGCLFDSISLCIYAMHASECNVLFRLATSKLRANQFFVLLYVLIWFLYSYQI